jgi:uncharacterized protein (TIGR00251 family)
MQLWVKVVPKSKAFSVNVSGSEVTVRLTEEPDRNKANIELVKGLGRMLGKDVQILRGATSRKKLLLIDGEEKEVLDALSAK